MGSGFLVWWKRGDRKGVLVDAMRAAEVHARLQEVIEDLRETICEVSKYLPPDEEGDERREAGDDG